MIKNLVMKNSLHSKISGVLIFILIVYSFIAIFITPTFLDEDEYHYPNVQNITLHEVVTPNSTYSTAYGPLPYFIAVPVIKMYDSLYSLRIVNYIVLILILIFVFKISKHLSDDPKTITLLIIANPYLLRSAFTYHMFNYGLLFVLMGIYYYFYTKHKYKYSILHICFCMAVLSQQWLLVVVSAFFLYEITKSIEEGVTFSALKKTVIKSVSYKVIFLLPVLFLFYKWGGLKHPNFQEYGLTPSLQHFTGTLANWGFVMMFVVLFYYRNLLKTKYIPVLFLTPLLFLTIPEHFYTHGVTKITGIVSQFATQIESYTFFPYKISMFMLSLFGLMALVLIVKKSESKIDLFYKYILLGFLVAFTAITKLGSTHIFSSLPFLILIFSKEINSNMYLKRVLSYQFFLVSLLYIIYLSVF